MYRKPNNGPSTSLQNRFNINNANPHFTTKNNRNTNKNKWVQTKLPYATNKPESNNGNPSSTSLYHQLFPKLTPNQIIPDTIYRNTNRTPLTPSGHQYITKLARCGGLCVSEKRPPS